MSDKSAIEWTDATWNPVTGCTQVSPGCDHCLTPETLILYADMVWRPIGNAKTGDVLVGFDESAGVERFRQFKPSVIENIWWSRKETLRLITEQTQVVTTAEHRWLRSFSPHWPTTSRLQVGKPLRQIGYVAPLEETDDYRAGYLVGMTLGDGTYRFEPGQRSDKLGYPQAYWRVALADQEPLERLVKYLEELGISSHIRSFANGGVRSIRGGKSYVSTAEMQKVELRSLIDLSILHPVLTQERETDEYRRGFLAGIFDAEGSNTRNLRISQYDISVLERVQAYGKRLGFVFDLEQHANHCPEVRLTGPLRERIRFFSTCQPAITRKMDSLWDRVFECEPDRVISVEPALVTDVVDIQTSTHTFFANGLATHNCYALTFAERFRGVPGHPYEQGFDLKLWPDRLQLPLQWKKPRRIFVNSMSDLFHKDVPDEYIRRVFEVMVKADWHIFQVLTKRSTRLARLGPTLPWRPHIWAGVSIETERYTWRADHLRKVPAHIRFISAEPLLGPLDQLNLDGIHWLISGGESGYGHRPCDPDWVRNLRDRCVAEGIAFFHKQWGGRTPKVGGRLLDGRTWDELPQVFAQERLFC